MKPAKTPARADGLRPAGWAGAAIIAIRKSSTISP
jgi:hypothetical protein